MAQAENLADMRTRAGQQQKHAFKEADKNFRLQILDFRITFAIQSILRIQHPAGGDKTQSII